MPFDTFFTSTFPMRSATARAQEHADPELLKLRGEERIAKIVELTRASRLLTDGEHWFLHTAQKTSWTKSAIKRRVHASKTKRKAAERTPVICLGFNTAVR